MERNIVELTNNSAGIPEEYDMSLSEAKSLAALHPIEAIARAFAFGFMQGEKKARADQEEQDHD